MKTKLCLPIIKERKREVLDIITTNINNYALFEVYIDYISDIDMTFIKDLIKKFDEHLIFVLRRLDKKTPVLSEQYKEAIIRACYNKKMYIDIDMQDKNELIYIQKSMMRINLITSFHDYEKTPRTSALVKVIQEMDTFHPTIYKIATFCESERDSLHLMHLLLDLKEQKKKSIILGMGDYGKITRLFGALYGNEITYTPESSKEQSAIGQLTRGHLLNIIQNMEN